MISVSIFDEDGVIYRDTTLSPSHMNMAKIMYIYVHVTSM